MDSSTGKMKQKPINNFFATSAKKDVEPPKSQRKISAFFGNAAKAELTPGSTANGCKTPRGAIATPPRPCNEDIHAARLSLDPVFAGDAPSREAVEPPAECKLTVAVQTPKAPAVGSTGKFKVHTTGQGPGKAALEGNGKAKAKRPAKPKPEANVGRKRLRRVIMDDEEGGDAMDAGLEDDVGDHEQPEDSEGESESSSDSDFSAEEEDSEEEEEGDEAADSEVDDVAAVGTKRKRPPAKSTAPAKRSTVKATTRTGPAANTTPISARTPSAAARVLDPDAVTTPNLGTASKGSAAATAGRFGAKSQVATPSTMPPAHGGCTSSGRSRTVGSGTMATPSPARSTLSALVDTPSKSQGCSELTLGVAASIDGEAARFADRMASRFSFLHPDNIRDAKQRRPDHPDYDPRTLYIPSGWFKEFKVSEGQQQWWTFKMQNFDSVLLFKMGKFYEMFEMDAYVGVEVLGLAFMRGEQPHAGFPEVKYADMAESLARAGYRVVVVEQTETPEMLAKRNEQRRMQGKKLANVVDRQKVAVLSRGTLVDAEMVASRPDASYVLTVAEMEMEGTVVDSGAAGAVRIGLCAVDAASGQVLLGDFMDDEVRSTLRTQLTALQPQELVLPRKALSATTSHVLKNGVREPRVNVMRGAAGDWTAEKTYQMLRDAEYFTASAAQQGAVADFEGKASDMDMDVSAAAGAPSLPELDPVKRWPQLLRWMVADGVSSHPAALAALGGAIAFLQDSLLDRAVLPMGRFEELPALTSREGGSKVDGQDAAEPLYLELNGAALENLEILENGDGGTAGTLLSVLDNCATPFGRRRLRQWLCRPLGRIVNIEERQDAISTLGGPLAGAVGEARKLLAGVSDLERAVARLHASTVAGASGRDAANVVLYEDAGKRKVAAFTGALKGLRAAHEALAKLREGLLAEGEGGGGSELLRRILIDRCRSDEVSAALAALEGATDWKEALATGRAIPEQGVDEEYDAIVEALEAEEQRLQDYLKELRQRFGRDVSLVSVNKDSHLLEVPESLAGRLGGEFELVGNRKGYRRFTTRRLKSLVVDHDRVVERKEEVLSSILTRLMIKFVSHRSLWVTVVEAVAELDALMSLAAHAMSPPDGGPMCKPKLVSSRSSSSSASGRESGAIFDAVALRHPAGIGGRNNGAFVPNDVRLGGDVASGPGSVPPFLLLSGPNMGGKSTMLRQVCLATVLAQIGAFVPAESLTLSPADAIFVRMGARDSIMTGQSTFFIELAETAAMLAKATSNSLVALDELGRGTATLDGAAVAGAVLQRLATSTGCRGLFATHYHHLSDEHANDPRVAVMHMACAVEGVLEEASTPSEKTITGESTGEEITFLYRLTKGACPKSYGTNVARLAGLPPKVVTRAAEVSAQWNQAQHQQPPSDAGQMDADTCVKPMEVDCMATALEPSGILVGAKTLLCDLQRWRLQSEQLGIGRLLQLREVAGKLLGGSLNIVTW